MQEDLVMKIIKNSYMELLVCSYLGDRKEQQDAIYGSLVKDQAVAIVADGMGGLKNGKCASNIAVKTMQELMATNPRKKNMQEFYFNSIKTVDSAVYTACKSKGKSGTTIVSATINKNRLDWLSVGDSRLYLIKDNGMVQLTMDHNLKNYIERNKDDKELIESLGPIDETKFEALTSYIGMNGVMFYDINTEEYNVQSGDYILLTTDGLYKGLEEIDMYNIIKSKNNLKDIGNGLLELVRQNCYGVQDNTSFILIRYI